MKTMDSLKAERDEAEAENARLRAALEQILADITEEGWELKGASNAIRIAREALAGESQ